VVQYVPDGLALDSFPGPLGQVITNLIENAFKHGLDGNGGVITLRVAASADTVTISVADGGKGIAPELHRQPCSNRSTPRGWDRAAAGWGCILPTTSSTRFWAARGADQCGGRGRALRRHHPAGCALISV
jgi:hypothetical protein